VSGKKQPKQIAVIAVLLFVFACVLGSQLPANAQDKTNPVKPSPESLAKGKKLYKIDCAMCHNENGDGKNDMDVKNVPDLTNPEVQTKATDGKWFQIIHDGKGDMPPEAPRAKNDDDLWNVVNYCRTLVKK
jgi:mono/diheme cytochrome c family protein